MNSGMAISANESTPSNKASPTSVSGNAPVESSRATVPSPRPTQNGTPKMSRTTRNSIVSGRAMSELLLEQGFALVGRPASADVGHVAADGLDAANGDQNEAAS